MTPDIQNYLSKQPLLLFDGECAFCNRSVLFLLKHERGARVHFVPLESEAGKTLRSYFEIDPAVDSIILIRDHSAFIKSCAALRLTQYMKGLWPLLSVLVIIPPFLRNPVYSFIAKHRMRIFGRVQTCALLKDVDASRIIT